MLSRKQILVPLSAAFLSATSFVGCSDPTEGYFTSIYQAGSAEGQQPSSDQGNGNAPEGNPPPNKGDVPSPTPLPLIERTFNDEFKFTSGTITQRSRGMDLLWVIDNSFSMEPYQAKLKNGFTDFANRYFIGGRDIRTAAIPTDLWVAGVTNKSSVRSQLRADPASYGPNQGACYSFLLPGIHDGPRPEYLNEKGKPQKGLADLNPDCSLNSLLSPRHSGSPILSTLSESGSPVDLSTLISKFQKNATVGLQGAGSERAFESVFKLLDTNESHPERRFFKPDRIRGIIFLADEHSQDKISFEGKSVDNTGDTAVNEGRSNAEVRAHAELAASIFKSRMDRFFSSIDGKEKGDPRYFVVSIANHSCAADCGNRKNELWGPEYTAIANLVSQDSRNSAGAYSVNDADINSASYSTILDKVGTAIEDEISRVEVITFELAATPSRPGDLKVKLVDSVNQEYVVTSKDYSVSGKTLEINLANYRDLPIDEIQVLVEYLAYP